MINQYSNKKDVLKAVAQYGRQLQYASADLKNDKEFVLTAVAQGGIALAYASADLRNDKEFVLTAVEQDVRSFKYASEDLRGDEDVVLKAVAQDGSSFKYTSAGLRNDKDFVLKAVAQDGSSFQYASEDLRNDKDFVLTAVAQGGNSFKYASADLRGDEDFVLASLGINIAIINHISPQSITDFTRNNALYEQIKSFVDTKHKTLDAKIISVKNNTADFSEVSNTSTQIRSYCDENAKMNFLYEKDVGNKTLNIATNSFETILSYLDPKDIYTVLMADKSSLQYYNNDYGLNILVRTEKGEMKKFTGVFKFTIDNNNNDNSLFSYHSENVVSLINEIFINYTREAFVTGNIQLEPAGQTQIVMEAENEYCIDTY